MTVKATLPNLEQYRSSVFQCLQCGLCREYVRYSDNAIRVCAAREATAGFEAYCGRGKMSLLRSLLEGRLSLNEQLAEIFYTCPTCRNCWEKCLCSNMPPRIGIDHVAIYEALRADLYEAGYARKEHKRFIESIEKEHNPYLELHEKRVDWLPSPHPPAKAELLYFVGCTSAYRQQNIAQATVDILRKAGVNFGIMHPEEWCCGSPALRVGARGLVKQLAEHNIKAIKDAGAKTVIFSCAGCYRTFKVDYPKLAGELDFQVQHVVEFIPKLIDEGRIKLKNVKERVTYHDPCHIVRHLRHLRAELTEQPRKILQNVPGLEFTEMTRNRRNAWCCGAGGGVKSAFNDVALKIAAERIKDAEETGANALVSSCPFCYRNLSDAIKQTGSKLKIYDITEIVNKGL